MEEERLQEEYPDLLVKIMGELYSINTRHVASITRVSKYTRVPGAPEGVAGIITFMDEIVPLLDMRTMFGLPSMQEEYQGFCDMLEVRKQDHVHWVDVLEDSIRTGKKFELATDPHKCAFGQWYDHFHSDNTAISFHMAKIEEPHRKLHETAIEVEACNQIHDQCKREKCLKDVFEELKNQYMPLILKLLDEAKEVFKTAYSEMVIVIKAERVIGIIVDEVLSVGTLKDSGDDREFGRFNQSRYISGVKQKEGEEGLILKLDDEALLNSADGLEEFCRQQSV